MIETLADPAPSQTVASPLQLYMLRAKAGLSRQARHETKQVDRDLQDGQASPMKGLAGTINAVVPLPTVKGRRDEVVRLSRMLGSCLC